MSSNATHRLATASAGLETLLPTSEAEVMRILWARGPLMVRAVYKEITKRRDIAYTTMTVCVRLAEKGLLRREKAAQSYGYVYTATIGEQDFVRRELAGILDSIAREYPGALAQYLDAQREHGAV
ncbi:MAG: BlaI/MecI/CopY family transcriptional regulator [Roseiflexaceae bacterium]